MSEVSRKDVFAFLRAVSQSSITSTVKSFRIYRNDSSISKDIGNQILLSPFVFLSHVAGGGGGGDMFKSMYKIPGTKQGFKVNTYMFLLNPNSDDPDVFYNPIEEEGEPAPALVIYTKWVTKGTFHIFQPTRKRRNGNMVMNLKKQLGIIYRKIFQEKKKNKKQQQERRRGKQPNLKIYYNRNVPKIIADRDELYLISALRFLSKLSSSRGFQPRLNDRGNFEKFKNIFHSSEEQEVEALDNPVNRERSGTQMESAMRTFLDIAAGYNELLTRYFDSRNGGGFDPYTGYDLLPSNDTELDEYRYLLDESLSRLTILASDRSDYTGSSAVRNRNLALTRISSEENKEYLSRLREHYRVNGYEDNDVGNLFRNGSGSGGRKRRGRQRKKRTAGFPFLMLPPSQESVYNLMLKIK